MALFKLVAPSAHTGGVDKVFGVDWNELINALTGGNTDPITLAGVLTMSGSVIIPQTSTGTAGQYAFNSTSGGNLTIANNSTATPFGADTPQVWFFVVNTSSGNGAWFSILGGVGLTKERGAVEFTTTQGTAASTNIYLVANVVTIENKTGASVNYKITAHRFS